MKKIISMLFLSHSTDNKKTRVKFIGGGVLYIGLIQPKVY